MFFLVPATSMKQKFTYIDVFSGCGGLSLGLEKAGFSLELAIEKSDMAAETFYHNFIKKISDKPEWEKHLSKPILEQAQSKLIVKEVQEVLKCQELMKELCQKNIDLLVGGPPCQGFSLAGRRNPKDVRNLLPWQFLELVEKIQPKAVLIENVAGMRQNFVKHDEEAPFEQLRVALSQTGAGYAVQPVLLNAMHYGVPQHRPRVMLLAIRKDISDFLGLTITEETWKSEYDFNNNTLFPERPMLAPKATHGEDETLTVKDALWDLSDTGYRTLERDHRYEQRKGAFAMQARQGWLKPRIGQLSSSRSVRNHVLRNHAEQIVLRFRLYQYLRNNGIPSNILNVPAQIKGETQRKMLPVKALLSNAKLPAKSPDSYVLAKTIDDLAELIISLGTKKHSQRPLDWKEPSPTIVSLPDDFVHPSSPRTMTVRELARLQSFPDSFEFRAKETTGSLRRRFEVPQYTQVGNAVPPLLAVAVGKVFHEVLSRYEEAENAESYKEAV